MLKFSEIPQITPGELQNFQQEQVIEHLLIDSRHLAIAQGTLFFALSGPRHDGHSYIPDLYKKGLRYFVISKVHILALSDYPQANFVVVEDCTRALQDLVRHHRKSLRQVPVLAITGSNAKTIIKEWLYQVLNKHRVIKSPKSYNSQVGVPLSVWQLTEHADLGIFEAGISQMDEMQHLESIIQPQYGIFTNLGTAHDAGFESVKDKARQKALLFSHCERIIYCRDHSIIHEVLTEQFDRDVLLSWSCHQEAKIKFSLTAQHQGQEVSWFYNDQTGSLVTHFTDAASIENLCHCVAFMLTMGYESQSIAQNTRQLKSIEHRLALKKGSNGCYLVDDTYNNDLAGLEIALDFLNQQPHSNQSTLILSDLKQAGESPAQLYEKIAQLIEVKEIDHFYGVGAELQAHRHLFSKSSSFYESTEAFLDAQLNFQNQSMLVKGAREFRFERIVESLEEKIHGTVLEIDLDALTENLNRFRSLIPNTTKIMVMVKAFAYGSGSDEIAHLLQYQGVDYLGVAYAD